jgi:hypothetical protein
LHPHVIATPRLEAPGDFFQIGCINTGLLSLAKIFALFKPPRLWPLNASQVAATLLADAAPLILIVLAATCSAKALVGVRRKGLCEGRGIWVWAESFSSDPNVGAMQIRDVFHNFSEAGLNFVLFLVKNSSGWLFYNSSIGRAQGKAGFKPGGLYGT